MTSFLSPSVHPLKKNVYFITDNPEIKKGLMDIGIKEKQSQSNNTSVKKFIFDWIRTTDEANKQKNITNLCRDSEMYEYLLGNLYTPPTNRAHPRKVINTQVYLFMEETKF